MGTSTNTEKEQTLSKKVLETVIKGWGLETEISEVKFHDIIRYCHESKEGQK